MQPTDRQGGKEPKGETGPHPKGTVVPFRPRPTPPRPSRDPDDPGPDSAA